jgi:hypothetical protein
MAIHYCYKLRLQRGIVKTDVIMMWPMLRFRLAER